MLRSLHLCLCICVSSQSSSVHHISSVALPSAFSDRRPCAGGKTDVQWVRSALSHICLPPWQPACLVWWLVPPHPLHNYTTVPICLLCINSSSWNPVLSSIRSQNHQQAGGWFSRAQTASQSEPCLDNNHIIPTQEHRQREKYSNQYCTLTSVWPLKFLPTRRFPPQMKEDIQLEQMFIS